MFVITRPGKQESWAVWCPACHCAHIFYSPQWNWNRNAESPSFWPSYRLVGGNGCHFVIGSGQIQYCADSGHEFAGKTVPMVDWDKILGGPTMSTLHTVNGKPVTLEEKQVPGLGPADSATGPDQVEVPRPQYHQAQCGQVGDTGEHGAIGSNAK